ncbi:hypothetical protein SUGI_0178680 [Cryptomeria japonica]|nr:hypothetical protein SUGI_0178680 [Cryptomeria japonica]
MRSAARLLRSLINMAVLDPRNFTEVRSHCSAHYFFPQQKMCFTVSIRETSQVQDPNARSRIPSFSNVRKVLKLLRDCKIFDQQTEAALQGLGFTFSPPFISKMLRISEMSGKDFR